MRSFGVVLMLLAAMLARGADFQIAGIDFFGYGDMDLDAVRAELPVRQGDAWPEDDLQRLRDSIEGALGEQPTDVAFVCCTPEGGRWIFIGLPGSTSKPIAFSAAPQEPLVAPPELIRIANDLDGALQASVTRGGDGVTEDQSLGYALQTDPESRALQLELREYALAHGPEILALLTDAANARHRGIAATAAGYMEHSAAQIRALRAAMSDPNPTVRNNATRALLVLGNSGVKLAALIPTASFIELLYSGTWSDRNKASGALYGLTQTRDASVFAEVKARGLEPLVEIARWDSDGHARRAKWILGRLAGLDEATIERRAGEAAFVDFCLDRIANSPQP
ncbi:MAG: HEAT repeat domain-containing protein [Acidobacteria bacterium]|nr:HEAT repeat domain-containing protein [Acidobacteriota bacterium]MDA1233659.1 HEAT repeat domain-containing protein [Acidobacteriota bacterium]